VTLTPKGWTCDAQAAARIIRQGQWPDGVQPATICAEAFGALLVAAIGGQFNSLQAPRDRGCYAAMFAQHLAPLPATVRGQVIAKLVTRANALRQKILRRLPSAPRNPFQVMSAEIKRLAARTKACRRHGQGPSPGGR
jgi:hypothetical protein